MKHLVLNSFGIFSPEEKKNIGIYIIGIMLYKFGLEAFNGSIIALATNRYDYDAERAGTAENTFERIGLLGGLNQACQCVGAILIAPLIKRYPTKIVLSTAIFCFGILTAILLIVDGATGGTLKPAGAKSSDFSYYGDYKTDGIIPIFCLTGIAYGMVELIRRVIPRDIVGGNVQKLRRMDALVHIFYEIAGTAGAFCTGLGLIPSLGNNFSFIITPIFFTLAAVTWYFVSNLNFKHPTAHLTEKPSYLKSTMNGFVLFYRSVYTGAVLIFTNRKFIWLLPGYSLALYAHRYLESGLGPVIARRYLGNSSYASIMVGGSNFGEMLGAVFVFLFTNLIKTPMPWLRLDAVLLMIVWYLPYWTPPKNEMRYAFIAAATFLPVSFGWAAGDVSLAAYIQASLARKESENDDVSALGAVMAFLYSTYIVTYAIAQPLLGRHVDSVFQSTGGSSGGGNVRLAVRNIGAIQFTVISVIIIAATFIPRGSWAFNPSALYGESLDKEVNDDESSVGGSVEEDSLKKEKDFVNPAEIAQQGGSGAIASELEPVDGKRHG